MKRTPLSFALLLIVSSTSSMTKERFKTLLDFLPRDLHEELKKFVTPNNEKARNFFTLKLAEKNTIKTRSSVRNLIFYKHNRYDDLYAEFFDSYEGIEVWDAKTRSSVARYRSDYRSINILTYTPTKPFYSGEFNGTYKIWDSDTNKCVANLIGHTDYVFSYIYNPDAQQWYTASKDKTIKIWDAKTSQCIATLNDSNWVQVLDYNKQTHQLYSGSQDGIIKIWDLDTSSCIATLEGHTGPITAIAHNSIDKQLYSASCDKTIRIWQLDKPSLMVAFKKMSLLQASAFEQAYECFNQLTVSPKEYNNIISLLDAGEANLSELKPIIAENLNKNKKLLLEK